MPSEYERYYTSCEIIRLVEEQFPSGGQGHYVVNVDSDWFHPAPNVRSDLFNARVEAFGPQMWDWPSAPDNDGVQWLFKRDATWAIMYDKVHFRHENDALRFKLLAPPEVFER